MAKRPTVAELQSELAALRAQIATLTASAAPASAASTKPDDFVPTPEQPFRKPYFFSLVGCAARVIAFEAKNTGNSEVPPDIAKDKAEIKRAMNEVRRNFEGPVGEAAAMKLHSKVYAFAKNGSAQRS